MTFLGTVTTSLTESSLRDNAHHGGEDMAAGACGSRLCCILRQEEGRDASCTLASSVELSHGAQAMGTQLCLGRVFLPHSDPSENTFPDMVVSEFPR